MTLSAHGRRVVWASHAFVHGVTGLGFVAEVRVDNGECLDDDFLL